MLFEILFSGIDFRRPDFQEPIPSKSKIKLTKFKSLTSNLILTSPAESTASIDHFNEPHAYDPITAAFFDPDKEKRKSKLIPSPHEPIHPDEYATFLTAFISIKKDELQSRSAQRSRGVTKRPVLSDVNLPVERFYTEQGVNYVLYYEKMDFRSMVELAKLIVGDFQMPFKNSVALFGNIYEELRLKYDNSRGEHHQTVILKPGLDSEYNEAESLVIMNYLAFFYVTCELRKRTLKITVCHSYRFCHSYR